MKSFAFGLGVAIRRAQHYRGRRKQEEGRRKNGARRKKSAGKKRNGTKEREDKEEEERRRKKENDKKFLQKQNRLELQKNITPSSINGPASIKRSYSALANFKKSS